MRVKIKNIKVLKENMVSLGSTGGIGDVTPAGIETLGSGDKMINGLGKPATQPTNIKKKSEKTEEESTPDVEKKKNIKDVSKNTKAGKIIGKINKKSLNS